MKWILCFLLPLLYLTAQSQNNIKYIKMQRTACFGRCPEYTVELFNNGDIVFTGKKNVDRIGVYKGKAPHAINAIFKKTSTYQLLNLKDAYTTKASDLPRLNMTFTVKGKIKSIKNADDGPAFLALIAGKIDSLLKTISLTEVKSEPTHDEGSPILNLDVQHDHSANVITDKQAQFPGGEAAMATFIHNNMQYPTVAIDKHIEGKVIVHFTLNQEGKIKDVKVVNGIGGGCDEEAVRVVNSMPNWQPAIRKGKAVDTQINIPIDFKLK